MKVKNIIFDFGGVLIDLDFKKTYEALEKILAVNASDIYPQNQKLFDDYEKGKVITENFLWNLQNLTKKVPESHILVKAWNAMILGWNPEKLKFLQEIGKNYDVYLLSNTNELHIDYVRKDLKYNHGIDDFENTFFKKAYYSHIVGMRKPEKEIYEFVLNDSCLNPAETLFIDDNIDNVNAARNVGIISHHHETNALIGIEEILKKVSE